MMVETTYTHARANFADLCRQVDADRDIVRITRRGGNDVMLISAEELTGLIETAHLLRSPANAARLLTALKRARGEEGTPQTLDELRAEVGLGEEE